MGSAAQARFSWAQLIVSALVQVGVRKESPLSVLSRRRKGEGILVRKRSSLSLSVTAKYWWVVFLGVVAV